MGVGSLEAAGGSAVKGGEEESRSGHVVEGVGHHCQVPVTVEGVASRKSGPDNPLFVSECQRQR